MTDSVSEELKSLFDELDTLDDAVSELMSILEPILVPQPPSAVDGKAEVISSVPLVVELEQARTKVVKIRIALISMGERVAL